MNAVPETFAMGKAPLEIAARLREALVQGQFMPGEALKIRDLAEAFGTSTQPVRSAIKQLITEQALEALPNRSARVPLLRLDKLEDLTRVRIAVEGLAVALAVQQVTPQAMRQLQKLIRVKPRDESQHLANHRDFHFAVYRLSGSTTLMPIIESLWLQLGPYLRQATSQGFHLDGMGHLHHHALLKALEERDEQAARQAVEQDILGSASLFTAQQQDKVVLSRVR